MSKKDNTRTREYEEESNGKHYYKFKQSTKSRKLYRNLDTVLKKKSLKELAELDYDDYR
jgi:hypothetical protein